MRVGDVVRVHGEYLSQLLTISKKPERWLGNRDAVQRNPQDKHGEVSTSVGRDSVDEAASHDEAQFQGISDGHCEKSRIEWTKESSAEHPDPSRRIRDWGP